MHLMVFRSEAAAAAAAAAAVQRLQNVLASVIMHNAHVHRYTVGGN